ncbi:conserved hypothetical protein [Nostocoides japonicum T1-X7]|uniref:Quercetin 2,3-dioxygenase n=1 Tax=Nostocoides japonicum T1-X7 TaxID=1194083 RepID=A0A077LWE1_9MICO|nr:pirin family protein [Tetrasphaera japonica]CCH78046.1 conserved hypothetical protein [Tetrasphaera japonica T1-X7]
MTAAVGERILLEAIHARISPRDEVLRFLPHRDRRLVGAWCFVDVYGPDDVRERAGMTVAPHPHMGLQTVSWIVQGEVLHRDSLGTTALAAPGRAAIMTAGRGISHSENSPEPHSPVLQGVQLWVALPEAVREIEPSFQLGEVATPLVVGALRAGVFMGALGDVDSGTRVHSPLVGAELTRADVDGSAGDPDGWAGGTLPLDPAYEHLAVVLDGAATVDGEPVGEASAMFLPVGCADVEVRLAPAARVLLLGGEPLGEEIVMWWNFVGRSHEEIVRARTSWETRDGRFGEVSHYPTADRYEAPALPNLRLRARGAVR